MKRRWLALFAALALVVTLLTACGGSAKMETAASAPAEAPMASAGGAVMDMAKPEAEEVYYASTAMKEDGGSGAADGSKRIYTANIELQRRVPLADILKLLLTMEGVSYVEVI